MDIAIIVVSALVSGERRVSPSWTVQTLRQKLYPITGIPPSSQQIRIRSKAVTLEPGKDDETMLLSKLSLQKGDQLEVVDTRPPGMRLDAQSFNKAMSGEGAGEDAEAKYVMPLSEYEKREDSVQAWKKREQLGRFDPHQSESIARREAKHADVAASRGIAVGHRCRVNESNERRGLVAYMGEVKEIANKGPGNGGVWVGIRYDEPVGKNDGRIEGGKRYFEAKTGCGGFVRPDRVEVGERWTVLGMDESLEEF